MITRSLFLTSMLGAAVALPYVMSTKFGGQKGHEASAPSASRIDLSALPSAGEHFAVGDHSAAALGDPRDRGGVAVSSSATNVRRAASSMNLEQVINFNVTPAWVMSQWPRVSASLAELDYQGYRVALVSGVRPDDVAGSLTYYFDRSQHAKRINFQGTTGDPRRLVQLVTEQFGMNAVASSDPGVVVYAVKWNNQAHSELRIRTASIVRTSESRASYQVELKLNRF